MNFEGVNFNEKFWKGKKESDFVRHESHHGLSQEQLKEAFALMNAIPKKDQSLDSGKAGKAAE